MSSSIRLSLLLLWSSHLFMDFFTGIWPIYKTIAEIDLVLAGILASAAGFMGEILQVFFGYYCDRGYRKRILILGLLLSTSILLITVTNGSFTAFLFLLLLMVGSGSFHPAALGITGSLSKVHKGRVILFFASGGAIGLAISQLVFARVFEAFHGQAFILAVPVALLLGVLAFAPLSAAGGHPAQHLVQKLLQPPHGSAQALLFLYLAQVANLALFAAFVFLLPDLLKVRACHSWLCMGGGHLCFILGSAFTMVPAGFLCDRYGQKSVLIVVLSFAISLFYAFLLLPELSFGWTLALLSTLGAFLGIINPIIVSWGHRSPPKSEHRVRPPDGLCVVHAHLISSGASLLTRVFPENPISLAISTMGLLMVICLLIIVFDSPDTKRKRTCRRDHRYHLAAIAPKHAPARSPFPNVPLPVPLPVPH